jgi:hypothetical protein
VTKGIASLWNEEKYNVLFKLKRCMRVISICSLPMQSGFQHSRTYNDVYIEMTSTYIGKQ